MRTIRIGQGLTDREWNRRMGKCNNALKSAVVIETTEEYRWEIEGIGQGHYTTNMASAIKQATQESQHHPNDVYKVEQFKPTRGMVIRIMDGNVIETGRQFNVKALSNTVDAIVTNVFA